MLSHSDMTDQAVWQVLRHADVVLAGNAPSRIYGQLHCRTGKRMQRQNRVFFNSEEEARRLGFRPCGHCMPLAYRLWQTETSRIK